MTTQTDGEREVARKRLQDRRDFFTHLVVYLAVNALVWTVWAITSGGYPWPIWMTVPWGFGVLMHGLSISVFDRPITEEAIDREVERMHRR